MNIRPVTSFLPALAVLALLCSGCSVSKNTVFSRTYHSLTTRYNVLFNGQERYEKAVKDLEKAHRDDYSTLLPVFLFDDKTAAQTLTGDMEYAIQKANKAILLHSIKAKPDYDRMKMTPEQRKFYNKKEFNIFIDNCYLLSGKSYFMMHDYYSAIETFDRMIDLFPSERILFETELWRIRALAREDRTDEAGMAMSDLLDNEMRPSGRKYARELNATRADLSIRNGQFDQAISYLKAASDNAKSSRRERQRYWYILGQLYLLRNQNAEALACFDKIKRRGSVYEMSFNARLNKALSFISGIGGNKDDIQKDLMKMLRDSKNKGYQDRIYFTLAEMERMEGNTGKALDFYRQSVASSVSNPGQKAVSALAAARLYDAGHHYIQAVAYYDTAFVFLYPSKPEFSLSAQRAQVLSFLVTHLGVVTREDSLQKVASMPEMARAEFINHIIAQGQIREQENRTEESLRLSRYYSNQNRNLGTQDRSSSGEWYFYNAATLNRGMDDFQMKWGRRVLEDNWRWKNKNRLPGITSMAQESVAFGVDSSMRDKSSMGFYLKDLPLTDSLIQLSHLAIQNALYEAGYLYMTDLNEPERAASCYRNLIERYPKGDFVPVSYYNLWSIYSRLGSLDSAALWKSRLLAGAPGSRYSLMLQDPGFLDKEQKINAEADNFYQSVYEAYLQKNDAVVSAGLQEALNKYSQSDLIPKFIYLNIVSQAARTGNEIELRRQLDGFVREHPRNEVSGAAQALIGSLDNRNPEARQVVQAERARVLFQSELNQPHAVAVWVRSSENINQLSFDILNFNVDAYPQVNLSVSQSPAIQGRVLVWIKWFDTSPKAMEYYQKFSVNTKVLSSLRASFDIFVISQSNQLLLQNGQSPDDYLPFFRETYLK